MTDEPIIGQCERCGSEMTATPAAIVEAFEVAAEILCEDCADEVLPGSPPWSDMEATT